MIPTLGTKGDPPVRKTFVWVALVAVAACLVLPALAAEDGKALYESKCAMCHGKDGVAKATAKGSANLNDAAWQKANDAAAIVKLTTEGKNKMPAFKEKLKAEQLQAIADYIKTLK
jgi:cytochrome c6